MNQGTSLWQESVYIWKGTTYIYSLFSGIMWNILNIYRSYGAIAGIVVGCLIFLAIFIGIIVAICSACTKGAGQTGRIVHPTQGVSMVTYSNGMFPC